MKVVRADQVDKKTASGPLFPGHPVTHQALVSANESRQLSFTLMNFSAGATNAFHTHTNDQVVVITAGRAMVATEHESAIVTVGDVVLFPAGEIHWHACADDTPVSMISVTPAGTTTTVVEPKSAS